MPFKLYGVNPALITPFTRRGEKVDFEKVKVLLDYVVGSGVQGVVPCGSTGEFPYLTVDERKRVIEKVVELVKGNVQVIAGTGSANTSEALELTHFAMDVGADAAIICAPYYFKPSNRSMYDHFKSIASKIDIPIVLYNIPQLTGTYIDWRVVEDLVEFENIIGLKDSSGNMSYIMTVLEKTMGRLSVVCGHDEIVFPALAAGGKGMILASANVIPDHWVKLYNLFKDGKFEEARKLQFKAQKLARIIVKSGAVGVKEALKMMGLNMGKARKPLSMGGELTYEDREELRLELEKLNKVKPVKVEVEVKLGKPVTMRFGAMGLTPEKIKDFKLRVGEALAGSGPEVAHIEVIIGVKDGPVGEAFARAKSTPTPGHEPLMAILEPNLAVKPVTLIVPTVKIKNLREASIIYGPAQTAVAKAVADTVEEGFIPKQEIDNLIIIANVFIHPTAIDRKRIYINNYRAMKHALRRALEGRPTLNEILEDKDIAKHPFKYEP